MQVSLRQLNKYLNLDLPVHVMVQPMPWQDEEGNPGVWVNLQVVEKDR